MACVIRWSSGTDEHEDDRTDEPICIRQCADAERGRIHDAAGDVTQTIYVDLASQLPPEALSLAKASEPRFDLRTADSVGILGSDPACP